MEVILAPMEGLVDAVMRDVLTRMGGIDLCVTEFVRVTSSLLPERTWLRLAPELAHGARTRAGTPVHVQLLGSDPACLADNAARAVELGAPAIDLNFGCPAKSVNRHRGGAILLNEPELLGEIVRAVRQALPPAVPVSAKMRLGYDDKMRALDCARALASGGASRLTVHARTKVEGYRPPAHWDWVARIREAVAIPVVANGEVWTLADYDAIRQISGCERVMIGRGLIARPDLAARIAARARGEAPAPMRWADFLPWLLDFLRQCRACGEGSTYPAARLKQWLGQLKRGFPEAAMLFEQLRPLREASALESALLAACAAEGATLASQPG
ncbi:tRNA dihydrouridine synthase [Paludibacterium purpuratum]|uniref:tRNA-dihydrouridine(16) synthase n=1 Tax=Paludibacterium purpuratum TaxID=1144873 RepID=A0A4R7AYI2_9NEIS|nr:tRNA-dihydrouridine synthase family protein [Paludibacterium purpuratum]TDR71608.1 tRNA-U20a,U20b-dihydrouridine synthase [Paludibacterium purpuratum]